MTYNITMFQFDKFKKPGDNVHVILSREPTKLLRDIYFNKLEPQSLKRYFNNLSSVYIDSFNNITGNLVNLRIQNSTLFARYVNKLAAKKFFMTWASPNVNPRNNVVTFYSSSSATTHTVTVPEGFYNTPTVIMNALVTALNTVTGASGLTFNHLINPLQPASSVLTASAGYYFTTTSLMAQKGQHLVGLPLDQVTTTSKIVGDIHLYYTQWIDIICNELTKHTKNPNSSNKYGNNGTLIRVYTNKILQNGTSELVEKYNHLNWINWNFSENISNIGFELRDQFNDQLYLPQHVIDNKSFTWGIEIATSTF